MARTGIDERTAFGTTIGLGFVAAVSYAVGRFTVPVAGVALGVGLLVVVSLALAARAILARGREPGGTRARFVIPLAASVLLLAFGLVAAVTFVVDGSLPELAWVGFAIVGAVVLALVLAVVGLLLGEPVGEDHAVPSVGGARRSDGRLRLLVVAGDLLRTRDAEALARRVSSRAAAVRVVAPALTSPLRHWTSDEDRARAEAQARLALALESFERLRIPADGDVGADDPLQAIDDELRSFPADEIVLVVHPANQATWLEEAVLERARNAYNIPVVELVGPGDGVAARLDGGGRPVDVTAG